MSAVRTGQPTEAHRCAVVQFETEKLSLRENFGPALRKDALVVAFSQDAHPFFTPLPQEANIEGHHLSSHWLSLALENEPCPLPLP